MIDESRVIATVLADLGVANEQAAAWCTQVNSVVHSETCAVPGERLGRERELLTPLPSLRPSIGPPLVTRKVDKLATIRLGSARYTAQADFVPTWPSYPPSPQPRPKYLAILT